MLLSNVKHTLIKWTLGSLTNFYHSALNLIIANASSAKIILRIVSKYQSYVILHWGAPGVNRLQKYLFCIIAVCNAWYCTFVCIVNIFYLSLNPSCTSRWISSPEASIHYVIRHITSWSEIRCRKDRVALKSLRRPGIAVAERTVKF